MDKLPFAGIELDNYYQNIITLMKETSTNVFNTFSLAFNMIEKDVKGAVNKFIDIKRVINPYFNDFFYFHLISCPDKYKDDYFIYFGELCSLAIRAVHNLKIFAYKAKEIEKGTQYQNYLLLLNGYLYMTYYASISYASKQAVEIIKPLFNDVEYDYQDKAIGELLLFRLYLVNEDTASYFESDHYYEQYKHWYSAYEILRKLGYRYLNDICLEVGHHLAINIKKTTYQRFIYNSIFFECILIDYLYSENDLYGVDYVINIGFDYYLELDTLMIILRHDMMYFRDLMNKLKVICLERLIKKVDPDKQEPFIKDLYNLEDKKTLYKYAVEALANIDRNDATDPRNREERITPDFLKSIS